MAASQNEQQINKPEATLHIMMRDGSVVEHDLVGAETRIGKGPLNDIILADASVSGNHAMISFENGVFTLSDLGSRNGTTLNDSKIENPRVLQHGDLMKMGHCTLTFRLKEAGDTISIPRTQLLSPEQPPPPAPPPSPKTLEITEDALAKALVSSGLVASAEVDRLRGSDARGRRLVRALIEEKAVTDIGLRDLMSRTFNIMPVDLRTMEINSGVASILRPPFLRQRMISPLVGQSADQLLLAVADPTDKATLDEVERLTRKKPSLRLAVPGEIRAQLDQYFTPRLIGVTPAGEKIEALLNQVEVEIGKAPHNRLVISDPTVSSTHSIVVSRDGGYSIVDLGSSNGTFVNGQRLGSEAMTLQHGDKIQLGQVVLTFRNPAETVENKTAKLSLEALEEVRRKAGIRSASAGSTADPMFPTLPSVVESKSGEEKKEKKKDKKKKDDDRIKAALVNSTSRILSTVLGAALTIALAYYITRPTTTPTPAPQPGPSGGSAPAVNLSQTASWKGFSTGLFKGKLESSGVAHIPGSNGVLLVSDNKGSEVLWMELDQEGSQVGSITSIPLGVTVNDPEAITYGGSYVYMLTSQSDPKDGPQNAILRFDFDPQARALRGQPEVVIDLRAFLLSNVSEIATLGAPTGLEGGLNIEGIAWDPNNERLLLGLRSPQIGNQAVLIPLKLKDPRGGFNKDNLKVDEPRVIVLSLNGQGIRDITYDTRLKNFLIISGAPETAPKTDFGLWEWNGMLNSEPSKIMILDEDEKPEGITNVGINGRQFVFVVGDSGSYLRLDYPDAK